MKLILITLVAVVLGSTVVSSYAQDAWPIYQSNSNVSKEDKQSGAKPVHVFSKGSKEVKVRRLKRADELNSEVSKEGDTHRFIRVEEPDEESNVQQRRTHPSEVNEEGKTIRWLSY